MKTTIIAATAALFFTASATLADPPFKTGFVWIGNQASGSSAAAGTGSTGTAGTGNTGTTGNVGTTGAGSTAGVGTTGANATPGTNGVNGTENGSSQTGTGTPMTGGSAAQGTPGTGAAQGSVPRPGTAGSSQVYSLPATIQAALASSSDLQIQARNVQIDRERADEAAAAGRPNLAANGSATRFDQATSIKFGQGPPIQVVPKHTETLAINLSDKLDFSGQIQAASDQARLQSLADEFNYAQLRNSRILRAKSIYFNLLRAQHQVQVAQAALTTANQQQINATQLNQAQVGQKIDVLRATTQAATAQQNLAAAQNNADIAASSFDDLVGRPLDLPVQAEDVPGVTVGVDVANTKSVGAPTPELNTPFTVTPADIAAINITQALQIAYTQRPEILAGQVNVRVAERGIKLARAGLEPTFSVNAAGDYYPTTSFQNPRKRVAEVTANISIPLYDGGATRDRVSEARNRTANAQTALDSAKSDVALDVRQSYLNLATAARQIAAANSELQQAVAARQLAELRYRGQVGLYLEVTDAQNALVQAENNQVDAVYNYLVARAQFQNATGTPQMQ